MSATTCSNCGALYDEPIEEAANEPGRLCRRCLEMQELKYDWPTRDDVERVCVMVELGVAGPINIARLCAMARHLRAQRDDDQAEIRRLNGGGRP